MTKQERSTRAERDKWGLEAGLISRFSQPLSGRHTHIPRKHTFAVLPTPTLTHTLRAPPWCLADPAVLRVRAPPVKPRFAPACATNVPRSSVPFMGVFQKSMFPNIFWKPGPKLDKWLQNDPYFPKRPLGYPHEGPFVVHSTGSGFEAHRRFVSLNSRLESEKKEERI